MSSPAAAAAPAPGLLAVTMRPHASPASQARFRDWYNNEHGPDRLRLPAVFASGLRYRCLEDRDDASPPLFLALYDVVDMPRLAADPAYAALRARRSPREAAVLAADVAHVSRELWHLVADDHVPSFVSLQHRDPDDARAVVTVAERLSGADADAYHGKHVAALARGAGWLRSRLFRSSNLEQSRHVDYLALHDYVDRAAIPSSMPIAQLLVDKPAAERRTWSLLYVFGPAPRDLEAVALSPDPSAFTSPDGRTSMTGGCSPVISSFVTTYDSLVIPYRLEGNPAPDAPVVAFSNALLTSLHMWDPLVDLVKRERPDLRVLRYDTRGRHCIPQPSVAATLTTLTADLEQLLDALRIPQVEALVGVSLGGATALSFAINNPSRLRKFVACDFNCMSAPGNTQAWQDRIAVASASSAGMRELADQTVARWLHASSLQKVPHKQALADMVAANNFDGFRNSCTALWDYDLRSGMRNCAVPGLFVVGDADAKALVKAMRGFSGLLGCKGTTLKFVPDTGHLPMWEDVQAFWQAIDHFL